MPINLISLAIMFCSGIAAATIVDFVRFVSKAIGGPFIRKIAAVIEILVWAFLGCATFYLLILVKSGDWRGVDAIAQIVGIIVYSLVLRRPIRMIGKILMKIFLMPFLWIGTIFVAITRKIVKVFIRILRPFKGMIKNISKKYKTPNLK